MKHALLQRPAVGWVLGLALVGATVSRAQGEIGDLVADAVLGEANFTDSVALPIGQPTFAYPRGIAIDRSVTPNRVYVADSSYNRVLGWRDVDALASGAPADIVIGQPDFVSFFCNQNPYVFVPLSTPTLSTLCGPQELAVDGAGNLYVADSGNCRVLIFEDPFGTDQVADIVLGQSGGCGNDLQVDKSHLFYPQGVAVDGAGNVYVADTTNCRVLEYDQPLTTDTVPDRVYGQPDFSHPIMSPPFPKNWSICSLDVGGISEPYDLSVDPNGHMYIGTQALVYEYDTPLTKTTWDHTVGNVANGVCNGDGESSSSTCMPIAAVADAGGHLYVADAGNSRVLEFDSPFTVNQAARVFGQPGFTGSVTLFQDACNTGGPSASSLCLQIDTWVIQGGEGTFTQGAALDLDGNGNLWVADTLNHRVLRYDNPLSSDTAADLVLGHTAMDDIRRPLIASPQPGFTMSYSTFTDLRVDTANSRILIEAPAYQRPVGVIGQPDFTTTGCNSGGLSASSLCNPASAMVDRSGNLWIADSGNNRVLEYQTPWYTVDTVNKKIIIKPSADRVFGQADFMSNACQAGPSGLCNPYAVAWDAQQTLYISDNSNNRVVHHTNPLADTIGDEVIGQPDFNTTGCNSGGASARSLCDPRGIFTQVFTLNPTGDVYVADHGNNRVLRYNMSGSRTAALQVFGQEGNMTTNACGAGADGLCGPSDVGVDRGNDLLIADTDNNRVLEFTTPVTTDMTVDVVFGQPDFDSTTCNNGGTSARSLCQPTGIFISNVYGGEVYVADAGNQRVLRYDSPYCVKDFQLTPATRHIRGVHSHPVTTQLKVVPGGAGQDQLKLSGSMILLDNGFDGPLNIHQVMQQPAITLSTSDGVVFRGEIAYLDNVRTTANGGVYVSDLRGMLDSGIDWFRISEAWHAPRNQPQYFHYGYKGETIGLDLSSFTESQAMLRLQFGSVCLDTALQCSSTRAGRKCTPARK
jgi:sugar lactone lactonase YvrE